MDAAETLAKLFEGKTVTEQKSLLAQLERAGAAMYRAFAANEPDEAVRSVLEAAAKREEENADVLDGQLSG